MSTSFGDGKEDCPECSNSHPVVSSFGPSPIPHEKVQTLAEHDSFERVFPSRMVSKEGDDGVVTVVRTLIVLSTSSTLYAMSHFPDVDAWLIHREVDIESHPEREFNTFTGLVNTAHENGLTCSYAWEEAGSPGINQEAKTVEVETPEEAERAIKEHFSV